MVSQRKSTKLTDRQKAEIADRILTLERKFEAANAKKLSAKFGVPPNVIIQLKKKLSLPWQIAHDTASLVKLMNMMEDPSEHVYKVRIKQLDGRSVYCRSNTSDKFVLHSAFNVQFHVPPLEVIKDKNATILDLGSNVGYTMVHYKHLYPKARVIGVEMDKDNFEVLKMNMAQFKNWESIHGAVWTLNSTIDYSGKDEETLAIHHIDPINNALDLPRRTVNSYTIQSILDKYNVDQVDFMKMDIEGAEIAIFNEDLSWIERVRNLHLEVHNPEKNPNKIDYTPIIIEKVRQAGFHCEKDTRHWSAFFGYR